jgi:hypothetical protein
MLFEGNNLVARAGSIPIALLRACTQIWTERARWGGGIDKAGMLNGLGQGKTKRGGDR